MLTMGKKAKFALLLLGLILLSSFASAVGDVAYVYKQSARVDKNVVDVFKSLGLTVDLIAEKNLPASLSQYKIVYVNDERFANPTKIPVNSNPTIVANYYHAQVWGLTDAEGVSQLASNHPLGVILPNNGPLIQVYTQATEGIGGPSIPYYYLGIENKAPSLKTIALTETTAGGYDIGDVISYASSGDQLLNGKVQTAPLCYWGIIESKFWTEAGKNLFKECISHVSSECSQDSECPAPFYVGLPFCSNGSVYQIQTSFSCLLSGAGNKCVGTNHSVLVQQCLHGCANGQCLQVQCSQDSDCGTDGFVGNNYCSTKTIVRNFTEFTCNNAGTAQSYCSNSTTKKTVQQCDDSCTNATCINFACHNNSDCNDNNPLTFDECTNPSTIASECHNNPINCASNPDCGFTGFTGSEFCLSDNVVKNFQNATCINPGTTQSSCSVIINPFTLQHCPGACLLGTCIACDQNSDCNDNNSTTVDTCINPGTAQSYCSNQHVICSANIDCGTNGFIGSPFCSSQGDSVRTFVNYTCNNPGTTQSSCSSTQQNQLIQDCLSSCLNGACISCHSNSDCNDNNPLTLDECLNPGTSVSSCRNTPINCNANSDCGSTGFVGQEYCDLNAVFKNFQNATCNNPGTTQSHCELTVNPLLINACQSVCVNGGCIVCNSNSDCDDNSSATTDICVSPGTPQSHCTHQNNNQTIACTSNPSCGTNTIISPQFCSNKDISQLLLTWTCNNPNTPSSFCSSAIITQNLQTCPQFCSNGVCVNIRCFTHADCNDSNPTTLDICNNPGTPQSFCTNNPIDIICSHNSDCGTDGQIDGNICVGKDITNLFQHFTCNAPGTPLSFCSSTITQTIIQTCVNMCVNGACVIPGECTPGETKQCGTSEVGVCEFGTQTCNSNGFWGACIGAINPLLEICDGLDNNCNGQIDEGGVCPPTPVCGNHILESGEQCDDGNTINGDGCSSNCTIEQPTCENQCANGQRQCITDDGYKVCRDYNGDGCTEWSGTTSCGFGKVCESGYCN
jgi:cysteine-rich repeat protein